MTRKYSWTRGKARWMKTRKGAKVMVTSMGKQGNKVKRFLCRVGDSTFAVSPAFFKRK